MSSIDWLTWIDSQGQTMRDRVVRWANINSGSHHVAGLERMADELDAVFRPLADTAERLTLPPAPEIDDAGQVVLRPLGPALRYRQRPSAPHQVFLGIHFDTVYGANHSFQQCRTIEDGRLNGPGVVDAKGGLAVLATALEAFERSPERDQLGWEVLLNPDEEIGSPGSAPLFRQAAARHHFGLLYEPALPDGSLVSERKGSGNINLIVHGKAAHAGRDFEKGRSAIVALAELIGRLHRLNQTMSGVTVNAGRISGGGALNVVADLAIGRFNVRVSRPELESKLEQAFAQIAADVSREHEVEIEQVGTIHNPAKFADANAHLLMTAIEQTGQRLGQMVQWKATGGACDGNKLAAAGLPNIDSMGPEGGNLHDPAEFVIPESFIPKAKLTALVLSQAARGECRWK